MLRSLLRACAAIAFAFLVAPAAPDAAPGPGLAYDEVVRVVAAGTPPPPGSFAADAAAVPERPRPGDAAGNAVDRAVGPSFAGLAAAAHAFLRPRLLRHAYWNGWERIDDPAGQTATIRKCDVAQVIVLDLAAKTYRVTDPGAEPSPGPAPPPPAHRLGRAAPDPEQPGTAVATLSEATRSLPPQQIENYPTTGYDSTMSFAVTQSTGSCHDASGSIETIQYFAALQQPTAAACPIRRPPLPVTNAEVVLPSGGCRPTFGVSRTGPTPPSSRLALYALVQIGQIGFLTERGNLRPLAAADAALFSAPADFTKVP